MYGMLSDFRNARLGDVRLTRRLVRIAEQLHGGASDSIPRRFPSPSEQVAVYRFFGRRKVTMDALLGAHVEGTARRCGEEGGVLVLHDTTEFAFTDYGEDREHLAQLTRNRHGFQAHCSLAVTDAEHAMPLGTLAVQPFVHRSQVQSEESAAWWAELGGIFENEHERWMLGCRAAQDALPEGVDAIHVADREGDSWSLLAGLHAEGLRYVIRCSARTRWVRDTTGAPGAVQDCLLRGRRGTSTVGAQVPDEPAETSKKKPGSNLQRTRRHAQLGVRWTTVEVSKPANADAGGPDIAPFATQVVEVYEVDPPSERKATSWILYTSEPIEDEGDAWDAVDRYRARWVIEEFFKGIKTGVAYESRQLTTAHALLNFLAVAAVLAAELLSLRSVDRVYPDQQASLWLAPDQIEIVRRLVPEMKVPKRPTVRQVLYAIARYGGHIPQNGPPGWIVLYRGWIKIHHAVEVARALRLMPDDTGST